ncbi:fimbrial protein [Gallibacterium trehalosifermentans]|uniref:Fimbrial protein n=1 Tax=Gallibacterium trehalosifermentans TaxID=516935 RepID=A0ABV6H213_9PAST
MKIRKLCAYFGLIFGLNTFATAEDLAMTGVKQADGSIVYTANFQSPGKKVCGANYSGTLRYEVRYNRIVQDYAPYFGLKVEASSSTATTPKQIYGNWQTWQLIDELGTGGYLTLKVTLSPPNNGVFSTNVLQAGHPLLDGNMEIRCVFSGHQPGTYFGSRVVNLTLTAVNDIPLGRTCDLALSPDRSVRLEEIFLQRLNSSNEVYGGTFPLQLNCQNATINNAYITYTDGVNNNNTTDVLTADTTISGAARNVGLKIYEQESSTAIRYQASSSSQFINVNDTRQFATNIRGGSYTKNYKVYYTKTGTPTAGSVTGKLIYNFYYR